MTQETNSGPKVGPKWALCGPKMGLTLQVPLNPSFKRCERRFCYALASSLTGTRYTRFNHLNTLITLQLNIYTPVSLSSKDRAFKQRPFLNDQEKLKRQKGIDAEPTEHRKENSDGNRANTWLRHELKDRSSNDQ